MDKQVKLVISHGERITEHNLAESTVVIGRDPQCDLFFADKKLSRRHARFEHVGSGVKLVDLGSRNGSWVNEVKVSEKILAAGDAVRLGGLRISLESERDRLEEELPGVSEEILASPDDSSTVFLGGAEKAVDDSPSGTIALSHGALERDELERKDTGTVALRPSSLPDVAPQSPSDAPSVTSPELDHDQDHDHDEDQTLERPDPDASSTVVFAAKSGDTGTVIYRNTKADPRHLAAALPVGSEAAEGAGPVPHGADPAPPVDGPLLDSTATLAPGIALQDAAGALDGEDLQNLDVVVDADPGASFARGPSAWSLKLTCLLVSYVLLTGIVFVWPFTRTSVAALHDESMLRGRALVDLLVADNDAAIASGNTDALSLERVQGAPGVGQALILDEGGKILAPVDRAGEVSLLRGIAPPVPEIRSFYVAQTEAGRYLLARPFLSDKRPVGLAVVEFTPTSAGERAGLILIVGSLLLLFGAVATVWLGRRFAFSPIRELAGHVQEASHSGVLQLNPEREPPEMRELALSLNAWAEEVSGDNLRPEKQSEREAGPENMLYRS